MSTLSNELPTTIRVDLSPFCGTAGKPTDVKPVYALTTAFVRDGWRYASDGRIVIRVPDDSPNTVGNRFPPTENLNWPFRLKNPRPWPAAEYGWTLVEKGRLANEWRWRPDRDKQYIGGRSITTSYHALIATLPDVRYSDDGEDKTTALHFKFRGGEGLIMGRND